MCVANAGPFKISVAGKEYLLATYSLTIRIANVTANETWGYPKDFTNCPSGLCYDPRSRTKVWGTVAVAVELSNALAESPGVVSLEKQGYRLRLTRPGLRPVGEPEEVALYETDSNGLMRENPVKVPVVAANQQVRHAY